MSCREQFDYSDRLKIDNKMFLVNLAVVIVITVLLRMIRGRGILPIRDQADILTLFVAAWVALAVCAVVACPGVGGYAGPPGENGPRFPGDDGSIEGDPFSDENRPLYMQMLADSMGFGDEWRACDVYPDNWDRLDCQWPIVERLNEQSEYSK